MAWSVDDGVLEKRLRRYVTAYQETLRREVSRYEAVWAENPKLLPDAFRGGDRVVAYRAPDGVLFVHHWAEHDAFEYQKTDRSADELAEEFYPGPFKVEDGRRRWRSMRDTGGYVMVLADHLGDRAGMGTGEVKGVEAWPPRAPSRWEIDAAREQAHRDVQFCVTAHLLGLRPALPSPQLQRDVLTRLREIISQFETLLNRNPREEELQVFLKEHPVLLLPSARQIKAKVSLGGELYPDFAIEQAEDTYILVEIERAGHMLVTQDGNPAQALTHAMRQVTDWQKWVQEHGAYAQKQLPGIADPAGWVVIGRRGSLTADGRRLLQAMNRRDRRLEIKTYDDLLDTARQHLRMLEGV